MAVQRWTPCFAGERGTVSARNGVTRIEIGNPPTEIHRYAFDAAGDFRTEDWLVLEYRAFGLIRAHELRAALLTGVGEAGETPLLILNDLYIDGQAHRMIARTAAGLRFGALRLDLHVQAPRARFEIAALYACDRAGLPGRFDALTGGPERPGFEPVGLGALYNAAMPEDPAAADSGTGLPRGRTTLAGVPFAFAGGEPDRIAPPPPPAENDEEIVSFGIRAKRGDCRPVSRDGETVIPLHACAKEVAFAAAVTGKPYERWGFCAKDPTILGAALGEVMMPLRACDVERFQVELRYENGLRDTAFPYNLALGRHVLTAETGVYAVPAGPWPIAEIVFHNRMPDCDVSVLAVTRNVSGEPLIPAPAPAAKPREPERLGADGITLDGTALTLTSGALTLELDIARGPEVRRLTNGYAPDSFVRGPLLKLRTPEGAFVTEFDTAVLSRSERCVRLRCRAAGLACFVSLTVEGEGRVGLNLLVRSESDETRAFGVVFPALDRAGFADWADSWYMFPKYQNVIGNGHIFVYEESAPSFPMQFFDLYSPSQGGGLGVLTMERGLTVRKYGLEKDDEAIRAYVEYPGMYMKLEPGGEFEASPARLFAHPGDWRFAFARYRDWLAGWYQPYKCQNKTWYRRCFWLLAEITDFFETEYFCKVPVWYDEETGEYAFSRIMREQTELYGCSPDILHLWVWTYDEKDRHTLWGHYGDEDYERLGGLDRFLGALRGTAAETGAEISLYLHPTLLSEHYRKEAEAFMPDLLVRTQDGGRIGLNGDTFRMCHANERWRQHVLDMYRRVWRETGIRILYVDEFSLRIGNRCWSGSHGHEVPSNLLRTDREFISALREAMPEEVVLYGEYAAADVNARYIDCNITYHILDSIRDMIETAWTADDGDDSYGRVFTDLYRFAFPGIVQLVLPMALRHLSWQPLKSTFFNGEAIYDSFWDAEESRGLAFMAKAFRIKKAYGDCFSSDAPETMLDSPVPGVCVNRWPGEGRTIRTLYNSAYTTARGALLELAYRPGARFYDVWNDAPCEVEVSDGVVRVLGTIGAQEVGCIVEEDPPQA